MYHSSRPLKKIKKHVQGSALVLAIFVLVIMTLLGSALIRMQSSSAEAVVYEVMGTRAYAAAKTGLQWQLTKIFPLNPTGITLCDNTLVEPTISGVAGLENCQFEITCDDSISHNSVQYYTLTSTGSCSGGGFETGSTIETSRTIKIEARNIN